MISRFASIGLAVGLLGTLGCSTVIKQTYYGVTGAHGKFYEVTVVDPPDLTIYRRVIVRPFTNELGAPVPSTVVAEINHAIPQVLADEGLFYPDGKALRIEGRIIHYTGKSGLEGSVSSVIGSGEECVCRVQLLDDATNRQIGEAICWGVVKSVVRRGPEELGIGVGKAVAKWIEKRLPEHVVDARQAELKPEG
ncbi:MAG: hypothetical protein IID37_08620 [Planctomycetes bacterium]|nr:hypothetical protein [Planctomycetota bacterium]